TKWQNLIQQLSTIIRKAIAVGYYREITDIEFDDFGFSREAALSRHFVNAVKAGFPDYSRKRDNGNPVSIIPNLLGTEKTEQFDENTGYEIDLSRSVSVRFLGLFDTVGSFYWPGNEDDGEFQLQLKPDCAQRVVQL